MADFQTPGQVRQALTTRLAALAPLASYRQLPAADAAWREVYGIGTDRLPNAPSIRSHLSFFFDDSDGGRGTNRRNQAEGYAIDAPMVLRFLFRIRPNDQPDDWDASGTAALHAVQDLMTWAATSDDVNLYPDDTDLILRFAEDEDHWLLVEVNLRVTYTMALTL